jgi:hypothetical protein
MSYLSVIATDVLMGRDDTARGAARHASVNGSVTMKNDDDRVRERTYEQRGRERCHRRRLAEFAAGPARLLA